jgi:eukaryotic-like serine/threonine-protein kinase
MNEPNSDRDPVEVLAEEFRERLRRGERPDVEEYARLHPDLAEQIRDLFPALLMVEDLKGAVAPDLTAAGALPSPSTAGPLERLGDYRILREVGRGGMGVVYEAEQESLGRRVALKVLPAGALADSRQRKRFEREAKAVARLHHTNIVPVFGVGEQDGTQYYVMQLIQGRGLDQVLAELVRQRRPQGDGTPPQETATAVPRRDVSAADVARSLVTGCYSPTAESLSTARTTESVVPVTPAPVPTTDPGRGYWLSVARIGAQVADALDYAAAQGVLHRDVKPSNILLDAQGNAWVTDFGLAKAASDGGDLTRTGDIVGTLRYMAPERFDGRADIRSEVYALGLTLYELLAMRPAFTGSDRNSLIKEVTTGEPAPPRSLDRSIPSDLETIVLKAIAREPGRRYQTAGEMAADLRHFLADRPVRARRVGVPERLVRWCRRNPAVAGLTGTVAVLLVAAGVASALVAVHFRELAATERASRDGAVAARAQADAARTEAEAARAEAVAARDSEAAQRHKADDTRTRAEEGRRTAQQQRERAEDNFRQARGAADAYLNRVTEDQLLSVPGLQPLRLELLASAVKSYQDLLEGRGDDPELRAALAEVHLRASKVYSEIGEANEAKRSKAAALSLYRELSQADRDNVALQVGLAKAGEYGAGPRALAIWEQFVQKDPKNQAYQREVAALLHSRARFYTDRKNPTAALPDYQRLLTNYTDLLRDTPDDIAASDHLGVTLNNLGVMLSQQGRHEDALALYFRANANCEAAYTKAPHMLAYGRSVGIGYRNIARSEKRAGRSDEALRWYAKLLDHWQRMARTNPAVPDLHSQVVASAMELGTYQRQLGRDGEAARTFRIASTVFEKLPRRTPDDLYNLAGARAVYATIIGSGEAGTPGADAVQARKLADDAMYALNRAVVAGYRNISHLQTDDNFKALRERNDCKELMARLETIRKAEALRTPAAGLQAQQELLALRRQLADAHPDDELARIAVASGYETVGLLQTELGRSEAAQSLARAVALREELIKTHRLSVAHRSDLVQLHLAIADADWKVGRLSEGVRAWKDALAVPEAAARDGVPREQLVQLRMTTHIAITEGYARAGLWREAADQGDEVLKLEPGRLGAGTLNRVWYFRPAILRLRSGDVAGYRRTCAALVERLTGAEEMGVLAIVARSCTVAGDSGIDPARSLKLAEKAVAAFPQETWRHNDLALACYRAGQFDRAVAEGTTAVGDPNWTARAIAWPVLAMAHHRQRHAAEARRWLDESRALWHQQSPLDGDCGTPSVLPTSGPHWQQQWQDWLTFEILFHEATLLITGSPAVTAADDHLHRGLFYGRLGEAERQEAEFQAAAALRPMDPKLSLVRARGLIEAGQDKRAADEVSRAAALKGTDARPWIEYVRFLLGRGRQEEADAAFARAAALTPDELNRFLEAGWWVAGPYPEGHRIPSPPEHSFDPSRPIPGDETSGEVRWQSVRTGPCGAVDLRAIFQVDNISAYALTHVWSPTERSASLIVGGDGAVRVWLNGRPVHDVNRASNEPWMQDRVPVMLRAGRNTLLVKVSHTTGPHSLCVRLADNPFDRGYVLARLALWKEASALWTEAAERGMIEHPNTRVYHETFLLAAGDAAEYSRYRAGLVERYRRAPDNTYVFAYGAALGPDPTPDLPWLTVQGEWLVKNGGAPNVLFTGGLTLYRAGRFDEALVAFGRVPDFDAEPRALVGLALAHHRLGHAEEARRWLTKATEWYDGRTRTVLAEPGCRLPWEAWQYFPQFQVLYREARGAIEGSVPKDDPNLEKLQARAREELKKPDRSAPDYDLAILLEPKVARHRLARGKHQAQRKHWDEAAADFAAAADLLPKEATLSRMVVYATAIGWGEVTARLGPLRYEDDGWRAVLRARAANARGSGPAGVLVPGNLLVNGSFEKGPAVVAWRNYAAGSTDIPGWTVSRGNIDVVANDWPASHGAHSLDLDGAVPGAIRQTFATVSGRRYRVTFDLAGNSQREPAIKRLRVHAAGKSADFEFDISGHDYDDVGWVGKQWEFTADGPRTTLEFESLDPAGACGPTLDNVAVVPVAEREK